MIRAAARLAPPVATGRLLGAGLLVHDQPQPAQLDILRVSKGFDAVGRASRTAFGVVSRVASLAFAPLRIDMRALMGLSEATLAFGRASVKAAADDQRLVERLTAALARLG
jgi:hypothetical protein